MQYRNIVGFQDFRRLLGTQPERLSPTGQRAEEFGQTVDIEAQLAAIESVAPGVTNLEVHLTAARTIAEGLTSIGLMQGDPAVAVETGAHALFFPHGIGHMLGLDVHDMEDLGDIIGYPPGKERSSQFGLAYLRLARRLEPGFVITVEPGIYFIPALIERWRTDGLHREFIAYDRVEAYQGFGGIRIEDNVLITDRGCRVLGPPIPKSVAEVEGCEQVRVGRVHVPQLKLRRSSVVLSQDRPGEVP